MIIFASVEQNNHMESKAFLKSVAEAYAGHYEDLSRFLFVFPGKRAGTFFLKHLAELSDKPRLAPQTTSIAEFLTGVSGRELDSRIDLLFTLYDAYLASGGEREEKEDFDAFRMWGEVVISDFSAVDMSGVEPEELFSNVRDHHHIQSSFLTEEQIEVLEDYFGVSYSREHLNRFWMSMEYNSPTDREKRHTQVREKFRYLWEQLWPLYQEFNRRLDDKGMAYAGKAYRLAWDNLREGARLPYDKIVFVGFNVLSKMEWLIFDELRKRRTRIDGVEQPFADFIWDATGPVLGAEGDMADHSQSAVRFIVRNRERFPEPKWACTVLAQSETSELPEVIEVHSAPSDVMQAKIAGGILKDLRGELGGEPFADARIAMVLPDEWLLLPTLYSIPEEVGSVNLTMGYPLRLTSVMSFMERVRAMQLRQRSVGGGERGFFHEDLTLLLGHPMTQKLLSPAIIRKIKGVISNERKYTLTERELTALAPGSAYLWRPMKKASAPEAIEYLGEILDRLDEKVSRGLESAHVALYRDALRRLGDAIEEHSVEMNAATIFQLVDRLLAPEKVNFEGEPLEGLQVMGLLETRCLDFDCLVIPSMSEKIFPMRLRSKTFIPDNLRRAYGMPPSNYEEAVFAYYFYRLISRASRLYMLHDARVGGLKSGDVSRYVLQLEHLYARDKVRKFDHTFSLTSPRMRPMRVDKTGEVSARLDRFFEPGSKSRLSASALQSYMTCPMKFFFGYVARFNSDNPPTEFMDAATAGTIVHAAVEALYVPNPEMRGHFLENPLILDEGFLSGLLADRRIIRSAVERATRELYLRQNPEDGDGEMPADAEMSLDMLTRQASAVVGHDLLLARKNGPIRLYGTEITDTIPYPLSDGRSVNMRFAIDRLDRIPLADGSLQWRVVDYKTGYVAVTASSPDDIFDPSSGAKTIFQPLLYANLFNLMKNGSCRTEDSEPVRTEIYNILNLSGGDHTAVLPLVGPNPAGRGKKTVTNHLQPVVVSEAATPGTDAGANYAAAGSESTAAAETVSGGADAAEVCLNDIFLERTDGVIREIFDREVPFRQASEPDACIHCNFRPFCDR